ncbi:N-acetyltransferase family protein [Planktotalea sp.]|uniref:GNAT family N-acetyltransferase n=1 Tax=Planktotalea sp. TaxID=2029877 RepID=UPI003D6B6247
MIVRSAVCADAKAICDIWNPLIENTATTFTSDLKTEQSILSDIKARAGAFFVCEEADRLLGFATYFPFRGGPGYAHTKEHSINLSPDARGRGAGQALMAALEAHAKQAQVHSIWAGISGENPSGVAFHKKVGFTEIARLPEVGYKFDRWMDLVLMQKILR